MCILCLCSVLDCLRRWHWRYIHHIFSEVYLSVSAKSSGPSTGIRLTGIWVVCPGARRVNIGRNKLINNLVLLGGEVRLGFPDLWSGQKPCWNWYLTPVVNFEEVRRAQLAKFTLLTSTLGPQMLNREWGVENNGKLPLLFFPSKNCSLGSCVCGGRPALGQNCSLGAWVFIERPALSQNTLMMVYYLTEKHVLLKLSLWDEYLMMD